jgi:hypothetical protein
LHTLSLQCLLQQQWLPLLQLPQLPPLLPSHPPVLQPQLQLPQLQSFSVTALPLLWWHLRAVTMVLQWGLEEPQQQQPLLQLWWG